MQHNRRQQNYTAPQTQNERQGFQSSFENESYQNAYLQSEYQDFNSPKTKPAKKRAGLAMLYIFASLVCVVLLLGVAYLLFPQKSGFVWKGLPNFAFVNGNIIQYEPQKIEELNRTLSYVQRDTFFPGVYIDGIHLGDKTKEEAQALLASGTEGIQKSFAVQVAIGDKVWKIDSTNVPVTRNFGNLLEQAWAFGRSNTAYLSGTNQSPIAERMNTALTYRKEGMSLYSDWTYSTETVRKLVNEIAAYIDRAPIDAQIAEFDFNTRTFSFTDDSPGVSIDAEELYQKVIAEIDKWQENGYVTLEPKVVLANVRKHDLMNNFKMVAAYTTKTSGTKERLANIDLACRSINGTVLMPGESFSFNKVVGQRTIEKGYSQAGTIAKGQLIQDVGGGVCQVSTTLYNAVVRADLKIDKRNNHAWPISYISIGEDAAVNWPNLDLQFSNNKNTPVFIIMYYNSKSTSCEIYGMSLGDGIEIDLESTVVQQIAPPAEPEYIYNANLPLGAQQTTVKARSGYKVDTYKIWKQAGKEIKREKIHTTTYKSYQEKIEYNNGQN